MSWKLEGEKPSEGCITSWDTRWGSHLRSLFGVLGLFDSILHILSEIINDKGSVSAKASADGAYDMMTPFEFVFILHFMIELSGMTDDLCRILQYQSQDILNAMDAVINMKELIHKLREDGWDQLFDNVKSFCEKHDIEVLDMNVARRSGRGRVHKGNPITLEHHYRIDIFTGTIDSILNRMNYRFDEKAIELLKLSSDPDPRDRYKSFNTDDICRIVEKFYPDDFTSQEKMHIEYQLKLFELDIRRIPVFHNLSTISQLCQQLSEMGKVSTYYLVDRLFRLILTPPVPTATSEHAFSAVKFIKRRLRNNMEDDFLLSSLIMYIEKEIAQTFEVDSFIDEFEVKKKKRRVQFPNPKFNQQVNKT